MLRLTIEQSKDWFFDRTMVLQLVEAADRKALGLIGYKIRREARKLMRTAKWNAPPSFPGKPPRARVGYLRKFMFYVYDRDTKNVVVGPALLQWSETNPTIPELHEFGGNVTRAIRVDRLETNDGERKKYAKKVHKRVHYPPRPYMRPALERVRPEMPQVWRNILREPF